MIPDQVNSMALWGKSTSASCGDDPDYHPLLYHMIDVGNVARAIVESPGAKSWLNTLAQNLGSEVTALSQMLPFVIALHDIGKASPSFQTKHDELWKKVTSKVYPPTPRVIPSFDHSIETEEDLRRLLRAHDWIAIQEGRANSLRNCIARALGAHHGRFHVAPETIGYPEIDPTGPPEPWQLPWSNARERLVGLLEEVFLDGVASLTCIPTNLSAACGELAGLAVLCDWLGSNEKLFRQSQRTPAAGYVGLSLGEARDAVAGLGLLDLVVAAEEPSFTRLFPSISAPRPLQEALQPEALPNLPRQALAIIEAPMGEGKTEAALLLAARLAQGAEARGLYFALPTIATSSQMYGRVEEFLRAWAGSASPPGLLLVNGRAELSYQFDKAAEKMWRQRYGGDSSVELSAWFLPRKRSLLLPYGVGTVDQAMVAALNVKFVSLRLLGLAGKVVVIDEVHSYDLYMSTIITRLLQWLRQLGASVILLSATLPSAKRAELVEAFTGQVPPDTESGRAAYPLITLAGVDGDPAPKQIEPGKSEIRRTITVEWRDDGREERKENARRLLSLIDEGGCAAWVCNTVREAQACFVALAEEQKDLLPCNQAKLYLFHASFLLKDRERIEDAVVGAFGKNGRRPDKAVVVATQVVEQSLDLDFDVMMTQLAPVDLLLQRAGRMHRHDRGPRRPKVANPRLIVLLGKKADGTPDFGRYCYIYEPFILLKTLVTLGSRDTVSVPEDIRGLVERVYDSQIPAADQCHKAGASVALFEKAWSDYRRRADTDQMKAVQCLLGRPSPGGRFADSPAMPVDDEGLETDEWVSAQTRLAEPSVRLVLLEGDGEELAACRADAGNLKGLGPNKARELARRLLGRSVSVNRRPLVEHVRTLAPGELGMPDMAGLPGLKGHVLLPLTGGAYTWESGKARHRLEVDERLGVFIDKEEVI